MSVNDVSIMTAVWSQVEVRSCRITSVSVSAVSSSELDDGHGELTVGG